MKQKFFWSLLLLFLVVASTFAQEQNDNAKLRKLIQKNIKMQLLNLNIELEQTLRYTSDFSVPQACAVLGKFAGFSLTLKSYYDDSYYLQLSERLFSEAEQNILVMMQVITSKLDHSCSYANFDTNTERLQFFKKELSNLDEDLQPFIKQWLGTH